MTPPHALDAQRLAEQMRGQGGTPEPMLSVPVYDRHGVQVHHGDCLDVLRGMPDASIDSIVTDPPYGLAEHKPSVVATALTAWLAGDREHVPDQRGFMGREWDGFVPPPAAWDEAFRVLKPGGHLLCFSAPRTADLMGISIRLAGFEMRDGIACWLFGQGMPKGIDVSKAIDKAGGDPLAFRRFAHAYDDAVTASPFTHSDIDRHLGVKSSSCYWVREDHRGKLPPRHHWEQVRDLLALSPDLEQLYDEAVRADRVVSEPGTNEVFAPTRHVLSAGTPVTVAARQWDGWNTALKPAHEPILVARKPLVGTVASNVVAHSTGALNIAGCRVGAEERTNHAGGSSSLQRVSRVQHGYREHVTTSVGEASTVTGRWPSNVVLVHAPDCGPDEAPAVCVPGCPVAELDAQSGVLKSGANPTRRGSDKFRDAYGEFRGQVECAPARGADEGGASRLFPTFRWEAKASSAERPQVNGVSHPTVKPVSLIRWAVRLVTPPRGRVLDLFAGSGPTGQAARAEGMEAVLVEREPSAPGAPDYIALIKARLDGRAKTEAGTATTAADGPMDLLDLLDGTAS